MKRTTITWGNHELDFNKKTMIMGILNVTPDSFSDGGSFNQVENAVSRAERMVLEGADIIDIGGESTRPGAKKIEAAVELERILEPIKRISEAVRVPLSIDTYKAKVAEKAIEAGASIINDVWGCKADPDMAKVAEAYDVPIILMHNREQDISAGVGLYRDLIEDMTSDLRESIEICLKAGVKENRIILDPGIGFAKTYEENIQVMQRLKHFARLGFPLLLGTSRKSLIAKTLNLPVDERMEGTGATVCLGIEKGCDIVRVHDVLEMSRMAKMMDVMTGKTAIPIV